MNTTPDYSAAGEGGSLDPAQAAALLDQTTQQTRRKTAPARPWLLAIRAVAVLLVLGACWLNVRGQHPYSGPTAAVLPTTLRILTRPDRRIIGASRRPRITSPEVPLPATAMLPAEVRPIIPRITPAPLPMTTRLARLRIRFPTPVRLALAAPRVGMPRPTRRSTDLR